MMGAKQQSCFLHWKSCAQFLGWICLVIISTSIDISVSFADSVPSYYHKGKVITPDNGGLARSEVTRVYSSLDTIAFVPVLLAFSRKYPDLIVEYHEMQTLDIYEAVLDESEGRGLGADLIFSSAMDLQMKLVNDGYARSFKPSESGALPNWASWRNEAFGVTFEPVVMVYNKAYFENREAPKTRDALLSLMQEDGHKLDGLVSTYDAERSGLGFLFLATDAGRFSRNWNLIREFGRNGVKLYNNSAAILDRVANGKFVLGYNLLGSYAERLAAHDDRLGIVKFEDYTTVLSRIAFIPENAANFEGGAAFLDYLLSKAGQTVLAEDTKLNAIHRDVVGANTAATMQSEGGKLLRPIKVGPGLLVYLDQVKRQRLLKNWQQALGGRLP